VGVTHHFALWSPDFPRYQLEVNLAGNAVIRATLLSKGYGQSEQQGNYFSSFEPLRSGFAFDIRPA
jgi:hypothetical protein